MARTLRFLLMAACLSGAAASVQAQPSSTPTDRAYCARLTDIYVRYIGHDLGSTRELAQRGAIEGQIAVARCREGDTAWAIPVLERQLVANKFDLPPRE